MDKTGKDLAQFDVANAVYAVVGEESTVLPFTYMNTFSKDRNIQTQNLYGDGELQDILYADQSITGAIGATARDAEFEKAVGFREDDGNGGTDEVAVKDAKRVHFGFETTVKEKGKPPRRKKVWVFNAVVVPPNESLTQNQDSITLSTFDYNYTGYGIYKKDAQGTADYVDANGQRTKVFTMSANPGDANYATFLESVPTPKMAAEKTV